MRFYILLLLSLLPCALHAQDPSFTQFYVAPGYVNPAAVGTVPHYRLAAVYRNQWPSIPKAYETNLLSFEYNWDYMRSGLGLQLYNDRVLAMGYSATGATANYAYQAQLKKGHFLRLGLQAGAVLRSYGFNKLTFADQLLSGSPTSQESLGNVQQWLPDFGTGFLYYSQYFWAGAAVLHFNSPKQLFGESRLYQDRLAPQMNAQLGGRLPLKKGRRELGFLQPAAVFQYQQGMGSITAGMNASYMPIVVGAWLRGVPVGASNLAMPSFAILAGYKQESFACFYSYDWSMGGPFGGFGGAHEISVVLSPAADLRYKGGSKWHKFIECPIRL